MTLTADFDDLAARVTELAVDLRTQGLADADRATVINLSLDVVDRDLDESYEADQDLLARLDSRARVFLYAADRLDDCISSGLRLVVPRRPDL